MTGVLRHIFYLTALLMCVSCGTWEIPAPPAPDTPNCTIAELRTLSGWRYRVIDRDLVICGRVTSDDSSKNMNRTLIIDDGTAAVCLRSGLYDTYEIYPVGMMLSVHLNTLASDFCDGILRIGLPATTGLEAEPQPFGHRLTFERFVTPSTDISTVNPFATSPQMIDEASCGRLVSLCDLVRADTVERIYSGQTLLTTPSDSVWLEVDAASLMANDSVPELFDKVCGIASLRSGRLIITPRNRNDITARKSDLH